MKKRNVFICFIFSLLLCFSLNFSAGSKKAFAEGESTDITITFQAGSGSCATTTMQLAQNSTISEYPVATYTGYHFFGWSDGTNIVDKTTVYSADTELTAVYARKYYKYLISGTGSSLTIEAETTDSNIKYYLSDGCDLETALNLISADIEPTSSQATINFDNITLEKNLELKNQKIILTGTINLGEYSICYTAPISGSSSLGLDNLDLNASSSQDIVKVLGTNSSTINISNTSFNASSSDDNYSINLEKPVHKLIFDNNLSYSTEYLYNFDKTTRYAEFARDFTLTSPTKVVVTIPYYVDQLQILKTYLTSNSFEFVPNQSNFTCSVITNTNSGQQDIYASTNFNLLFDENGGVVNNAFTTTSSQFRLLQQLDFPTEHNYTKEHFTLDSFVGKLTIDSTDYYFDVTALSNYLNDSTPTIQEHFYSIIPAPDSSAVGFTYYKFSGNSSDINFLATDLMLSFDKTPTFVAVWKNISYSVYFEENGGTDQTNKTGIFGSALTLPTASDISKNGYDFVGWFTSPELASEAYEANKINPSNWTTMPDTNPTLYAGWKIRSHKLSIFKNDQTATIEKTIDYGTLLNTISEISDSISKTGYTFAGWFTNELLTTPLEETQAMPDSDFSVYAAWTINKYTITLYLNHSTDSSVYKTATRDYKSNITDLFTEDPSFVGDSFAGWFTDTEGRYQINPLPEMMPAEDLNLYASWSAVEYYLSIYYPALSKEDRKVMHFGDDLPLYSLDESGFIFEGWYADEDFTEEITTTTMPNSDFAIYAKFKEKLSITLDIDPQSFSESDIEGFVLESTIEGFMIEYLVNGEWTEAIPKTQGIYDIRISRSEDNTYKSYLKTFKSAFVVTEDELNVSVLSLIFYCVAAFELICSIIVLFLRKQRKTYLTYAVALPFGVIPTSQFVNLMISLALMVFGFVLLTIQLVKLKKVNNEIAKISSENKEYTPPDVSENESISKKVEIMLQQQGFVSTTDVEAELDEEENEFKLSEEDGFSKLEEDSNDDEYLNFESDDDKNNIE